MYRTSDIDNNLDDNVQQNNKKYTRYAEAFIIPQKYENLYSYNNAFKFGTIFYDLNIPFDENSKKVKKVCKR